DAASADEPTPEREATATEPPAEPPAEADLEVVFSPEVAPGRGVPLPFLQLQSQLATGRRLSDPRILIPERSTLGPEAEAAVESLLARMTPESPVQSGATILPDDRLPEPEGAEYTLRTILDGPFRRMAWESALEQFRNYFTLPLTPELEARAHFYRAQIYYFLGQEQRAVLEFLLARDTYYVEVEAWLDRILGHGGT
ncbi:MAG: tetratricopeptide repeat protein, partial [Spirochaetota bacterium]